ncbi:glycoside hydrolase family 72 [Trichoderma reesei QM6a]|uniref:1,3-beta-glucanosyltransferase n=1 Tax=Hypocrea jecorina (strain QM6a) TaxID=431241 RepID=G0RJJ2_HYPJQ|nr:glycoside hydrolase family 72 [Trichoderma reesei QM6a]EGR48765.1 glycoside hydrolase family 72 [Trichoderma reesei QM6a]
MQMQTALVALAATAVGAVKPLSIKGTDFVDANGNKFQLVGVAYQPGGSAGYNPKKGKDPLSDPDTCMRDAALLQVMGVNAIRVYNLDPNLNHDQCASIFNAAGMYMILDVNSPLVGEAITSFEPWTSYYEAYSNRTFAIAEAFSNYPNTLMYFSGNEVINDVPTAQFVPPYLRAVTRDLKNYIKKNIKRQIPVGYSAADVREVLWDTWNYMQCSESGDDGDMSRADVFAINSYSWCGPDATYESSSYDVLTDNFKNTSIPVFFSEYGCNTPMPRYWNETQAIYGSDMTPVFSGGVVYEYTEEENHYGLVNITGDTLQITGDYNRLKAQLAKIDWEKVQSQKASGKAPAAPKCSSKLIQVKGFDSNFTLPVPPPGVQGLIDNGIKNKPSGSLVKISDWSVKLNVNDADGNKITNLKVVPLSDDETNWSGKNSAETGSGDKDSSTSSASKSDSKDKDSAAAWMRPASIVLALPLVAMLFI